MATARKNYRCRCGVPTVSGSRRCAACRYADIVLHEGVVIVSQGLPVTCWCERTTAFVLPSLIKAGFTRSCGASWCGPELVAAA